MNIFKEQVESLRCNEHIQRRTTLKLKVSQQRFKLQISHKYDNI